MIQFLVALALCYVLIKIPFWILGSIRGGGKSFVGGLIRGLIAYKTFGLLGGKGGGGKAGKRSPSRDGRKPAEPPDPYAKTRANADGQYMLPLNVKRVRKPSRPKPPPDRPHKQKKDPNQLELPLDGEWPENKPRRGRDGQYELPFDLPRRPKPKREKPVPDRPREPKNDPNQTKLPWGGEWPENKPRRGRHGQYELPFDLPRQPKPKRQKPEPEQPREPKNDPNQTTMPRDGQWPENRPKRGRDGQYQLPLNVHRTRKPTRSRQSQPPPQPRQRPRSRQQQLPLDLPQDRPNGGEHR